MCASEKDRTGLAEHEQSAQIIAKHLRVKVIEVDKELMLTGHTGVIPGSCIVEVQPYGALKPNQKIRLAFLSLDLKLYLAL